MKKITPQRAAQVTEEQINTDTMQRMGIMMSLEADNLIDKLSKDEMEELMGVLIEDWEPETLAKMEQLVGYEIVPTMKTLG